MKRVFKFACLVAGALMMASALNTIAAENLQSGERTIVVMLFMIGLPLYLYGWQDE